MSSDAHEARETIRTIVRRRAAKQQSFVKVTHITANSDLSPQQAGANLSVLADEGLVEKFNSGSNGTTWKITMEGFDGDR